MIVLRKIFLSETLGFKGFLDNFEKNLIFFQKRYCNLKSKDYNDTCKATYKQY